MFSTTVDAAIGLILIYLVLSLLCTSVNEAIAGLFRLRARVLFVEIGRILGDDDLRKAFWNTGIMKSLGRGPSDVQTTAARSPSYVKRDDFILALIQALRSVGSADGAFNLPANGVTVLSRIDKRSILYAVVQELGIDPAASPLALKEALGGWFDDVMERASGVYKRYMSLLSFLVALLIVVATNADTLTIAETIWRDDALRGQLVKTAARMMAPSGAVAADVPSPDQIADITAVLLPLPLGWDAVDCAHGACLSTLDIGAKSLGLLLTAFAVTLGAPFWFDLLSRFVSVRNSGPSVTRDRS